MDATDRDAKIEMLIDALRLMASPADIQAAVLPDFVAVPDEVALRVMDAYVVLHPTELPGRVQKALRPIIDSIERLPLESAEQWNPATLGTTPYEDLRRLATVALKQLGATYEPPKLRGMTYVRGPADRRGPARP